MKLISLTQNKFAKVSDHRYNFLNQWKWHFNGLYAVRTASVEEQKQGSPKPIYMHHVLCPPPKGLETDHEDRDKLNNQDENLRTFTQSQNQMNRGSNKNSTSKYKGVSWADHAKKWLAQIKVNTKQIYIGTYHSEIEAAKDYDKVAVKYRGEFAVLNFPLEI